MRSLILFCVLILFLFSCSEPVQDDSTKTKPKPEITTKQDSVEVDQEEAPIASTKPILFNKDSLVKACEQHVIDNYQKNIGEETFGKDIQINGSIGFENEDFLVINIEEIIEYGSWNYTESSMIFNKSRGRLELVKVDSKKDENWEITENLFYEGRINGLVEKSLMLNGNDRPDFIVYASQTRRTQKTIWGNIYELDLTKNHLKLFDLSSNSQITMGECEGEFGHLEKFIVSDTKSDLPIVEIQISESECIDFKVVSNELPNQQYQWDPSSEKFLKIK